MNSTNLMSKENLGSKERAMEFERFIVSEYLKYGSVDEIFRVNRDRALGVSYPGVFHILKRWGVVRALGRNNTPLTESVEFLVRKIEDGIPLETLYRTMPPSFRPTMATLHTIYRWAKVAVKTEFKKREMRRFGTALVVSPQDNPYTILLGRDVSPPRLDIGKPYGAISLPMGFSKKDEGVKAVVRVLQQEVFSGKLLESPDNFRIMSQEIAGEPDPFMFLDIADVRVAVYHLDLPSSLSGLDNFSSFKLRDFRYAWVDEIVEMPKHGSLLRHGIEEISRGYLEHLENLSAVERSQEPIYMDSIFNQKLAILVAQEEAA